jgi:hypothetical protein
MCRHLDGRQIANGVAYCWQWYAWRQQDEVVSDCEKAARPDGAAPPGQIVFEGQRR